MSEYVPTTAEVTEWATDMLCYRLSFEDAEAAVTTWLAAHDAEVAAKAYERAILDVGLNPDLANQLLDTNPYRKAVQHE